MVYQTQSNGYVALKAQAGLGSQASGSGARILRTAGGAQGKMSKTAIESNEVRRDGMRARGRHGSQQASGAYDTELSLGSLDDIIAAVMRGSWGSADLAITQVAMTSVTTTTSTIVAAGGSWITQGLRVGDIIRATGLPDAANNSKNLRITGLTASTITVAEALVANAGADTSFSITRPGRTIINPATLSKSYFTIEEHELDIDGSEIFTDCVWGSIKFSMQPNGLVMASPNWVGTGQFETKTGVSAPHFTSPTETTADPMSALDATLRFGTGDVVDLQAFDLTIDIGPTAPAVAASRYSPEVFTGQMAVSLNLTLLRQDLLRVGDYLAETQCSLHLMAPENESAPQDFFSIFVPNFTLGTVDKSALGKDGGGRTQSITVPPALVGKDNRGGAYDATMIKFQVSNAS